MSHARTFVQAYLPGNFNGGGYSRAAGECCQRNGGRWIRSDEHAAPHTPPRPKPKPKSKPKSKPKGKHTPKGSHFPVPAGGAGRGRHAAVFVGNVSTALLVAGLGRFDLMPKVSGWGVCCYNFLASPARVWMLQIHAAANFHHLVPSPALYKPV